MMNKCALHILTEEMLMKMWRRYIDEDVQGGAKMVPDWEEYKEIWMRDPEVPEEDDGAKMVPNWEEMECMLDLCVAWTNRAVSEGLLKGIKHGDTIRWRHNAHDRNQGLMFWSDADGIVLPYTRVDDYGSVPPCFRVGEHGFTPDYWLNHVEHNSLFFMSHALLEDLKREVDETEEGEHPFLTIYGKEYEVRIEGTYPDDDVFEYIDYLDHLVIEQV